MTERFAPLVHIEDPDQNRTVWAGFESLRLTYCDRWFPMKSPSLAAWAPMSGMMCKECLQAQRQRRVRRPLGHE